MTKKQQRNFHQGFIDSWTRQLDLHDFAVQAMSDTPEYKRVKKAFDNKRKRILWNITRATNLKKSV